MMLMLCVASATTVGAKNRPLPAASVVEWPPQRIRAPNLRASCTWVRKKSQCVLVFITFDRARVSDAIE